MFCIVCCLFDSCICFVFCCLRYRFWFCLFVVGLLEFIGCSCACFCLGCYLFGCFNYILCLYLLIVCLGWIVGCFSLRSVVSFTLLWLLFVCWLCFSFVFGVLWFVFFAVCVVCCYGFCLLICCLCLLFVCGWFLGRIGVLLIDAGLC